MNITVFGATGAIGRLTVIDLLNRGDTVTIHARNPDKIPTDWEGRVKVVIGEVTDPTSIDKAIVDAEAVVSALGPSMDKKTTGLPLVEGVRLITEAMRRHGIRRYIGHGTPSIADPQEKQTLQTRLIRFMGSHFLPRAYKELVGMSELIMVDDLDWTIVRFTAPKNGEGTGRLRVGFYGANRIGFAVTRADIAHFTAEQAHSDTYVNRAPAISS
ncbi:NAD(P)-dependent oxidoreductase [Rothia uropygialis]|uniref:NAD(P)-dependent oxidoreductase n=1 Tax=Kocuria sp. 36 TaxID=1415402 RepID=UPI00101C78F5|nr:NAD(P)H-binding protein [Kocuria sp. 36]